MLTETGGNVGIGTTIPAYSLDVEPYGKTGSTTFNGSGLNDGTFSGTFNNPSSENVRVKIASTGTPDQIQWSVNGGSTYPISATNITGSAQALGDTGLSITFAATTGHTVNNYWQVTGTPGAVVNSSGSMNINGANLVSLFSAVLVLSATALVLIGGRLYKQVII